jgi:hypothetical protein
MKRLLHASALSAVVLVVAPAAAQQPGTAVQLPTYSFFGTGTSVSVPDRGAAYMGGIKRAASGLNEFGTPLLKVPGFRNRAMGMERSSMGTSVGVYIHDFEAMEEALLGGPPSSVAAMTPRPAGSAYALRPRVAGGTAALSPRVGPPEPTLAEVRSQQHQEQLTREEEAADFYRRGREAEAAGKRGVAKIYYQMAARRAAGDLKREIVARLDEVSLPESSKLAQGSP